MVHVLVLKADGSYEKCRLKNLDAYQKAVGGNVELLYVDGTYAVSADPAVARRTLMCYANNEYLFSQLPQSHWGGLLHALGLEFEAMRALRGNVIVMSRDEETEDEADIDPYVVGLLERYMKEGGDFLRETRRFQDSGRSEEEKGGRK